MHRVPAETGTSLPSRVSYFLHALLTVCLQVGDGIFHPTFQRLRRHPRPPSDHDTCHLTPTWALHAEDLPTLAGDVAGCSVLVISFPQLDSKLLSAGTRSSPSFISHIFTPSRLSIWQALITASWKQGRKKGNGERRRSASTFPSSRQWLPTRDGTVSVCWEDG